MSLETFSYGLYDSSISTWLRSVSWVVPSIQSTHIVAIAALAGSALVMDLRLAGVLATDEAPGTIVRRHLPWLWSALAILVLTGTAMVVAEPYRELMNRTFWYKMIAIASAFVLTLLFRYPILHPQFRLEHAKWALLVKPAAWASLGAWAFAIYCGRWIAYTW